MGAFWCGRRVPDIPVSFTFCEKGLRWFITIYWLVEFS